MLQFLGLVVFASHLAHWVIAVTNVHRQISLCESLWVSVAEGFLDRIPPYEFG